MDMEECPSISETILVDVAGEEQGGARVPEAVEVGETYLRRSTR
jgi:hypothetical protein